MDGHGSVGQIQCGHADEQRNIASIGIRKITLTLIISLPPYN